MDPACKSVRGSADRSRLPGGTGLSGSGVSLRADCPAIAVQGGTPGPTHVTSVRRSWVRAVCEPTIARIEMPSVAGLRAHASQLGEQWPEAIIVRLVVDACRGAT